MFKGLEYDTLALIYQLIELLECFYGYKKQKKFRRNICYSGT